MTLREAAAALKAQIDADLAKMRPTLGPLSCNCGAIHSEAATVVGVKIPDDPASVPRWYMWNLEIVNEDGATASWTIGLSAIFDPAPLDALFAEHFDDLA